jgi:hypothetical protein
MDLYAIFRRSLTSPDELPEVDSRSQAELDRRAHEVRKVRSYVFEEEDGSLGTICVYEADNPDVIREHGTCANVAVSDIRRITAIDVHRPDPERLRV